jgi:ATP-dependent Clp protease protease subunit
MLDTDVNEHTSSLIVAQLLFLESQGNEDITFFINSPGGSVTAGLAIYDTMQFIKPDVATYVMGQACSMGSFLAQAGQPGKRFVLPESRTMIHRVSSGSKTQNGQSKNRCVLTSGSQSCTLSIIQRVRHTKKCTQL